MPDPPDPIPFETLSKTTVLPDESLRVVEIII